jgi:hypothetical protein
VAVSFIGGGNPEKTTDLPLKSPKTSSHNKDKYIFFYHYLLTLLGQQHIGTFRMKKYMITKTYRCNQASTENI